MEKFYIYETGATVFGVKDGVVTEYSKHESPKVCDEQDTKIILEDIDKGIMRSVSSVKDGFGRLNQIEVLDDIF